MAKKLITTITMMHMYGKLLVFSGENKTQFQSILVPYDIIEFNICILEFIQFVAKKGGNAWHDSHFMSFFQTHLINSINHEHPCKIHYLGLIARKPVFGGLRTTKAQTSLRICAV